MKNLTTGHSLKLIFFFALPLMFGNLLQQLYIMVDTMIVGRFVGVDALASIGGADWINWAILGLLMGFTQGFSIRVSNCLGANDEKGMEKSIAMSYLSCFVIAILVIIFSQIIIEPLLKLLNTPSHTIQGSITYLRIMSGGALIVIFYNCFSSILRAIGDSRTPLIAMVIAACLNVILDLLFVCIFHQGIAGAAIATLISQLFAAAFCYFKIRKEYISLIEDTYRQREQEWKKRIEQINIYPILVICGSCHFKEFSKLLKESAFEVIEENERYGVDDVEFSKDCLKII